MFSPNIASAPHRIAKTTNRFESLDSLRGIAALIVVFAHFSTLFDRPHAAGVAVFHKPLELVANNWMFLLKMTPLCIVMQGHASVVLFFLLSGFVLAIPFTRPGANVSEWKFIARRIVRIYPPYFMALIIAVSCDYLISTQGIAEMSHWFNSTWNRPVNASDLIAHVLFIGSYDNGQYNTAFWSLIYEMRVSILYPALFYVVTTVRATTTLALSVGLILLGSLGRREDPDWLYTIAVIGMFLIGSLIYIHRDRLVTHHMRLSVFTRRMLLVISLLGFGYGASTIRNLFHRPLAGDLLLTLFSAEILVLSLSDDLLQSFLHHRHSLFLGKISYSLYLTHATVIFSLVYLTKPLWSASGGSLLWPVILFVCLALILVIAWLFYQAVERPSSQWSKAITFYRTKSELSVPR